MQAEAFRRAHGRGLELRYSCHRCDGPISEAMAVCPWCGSTENSFREITPHPLYCPDCEGGNLRPREGRYGRFLGMQQFPILRGALGFNLPEL